MVFDKLNCNRQINNQNMIVNNENNNIRNGNCNNYSNDGSKANTHETKLGFSYGLWG